MAMVGLAARGASETPGASGSSTTPTVTTIRPVAPPATSSAPPGCSQADLDRPETAPTAAKVTVAFTVGGANGYHFEPPPAGRTPAISPERAAGLLHVGGRGGGQEELLLAVFSAAQPSQLQPDGSFKPIYTKVLVWALFSHHHANLGGHDAVTTTALTSGPASMAPLNCTIGDYLALIDADTGSGLFSAAYSPG